MDRTKIISEEKLYIIAFLGNLLLFITEIIGFVIAAVQMGTSIVLYYTELSNFLLLLSSFFALLTVYFNVWKGCGTNYPTHLLRYVSTAASTLTVIVVLTVLMPMYPKPWTLLTDGSMLFHHTLCPLLSLVNFLFFEKEESRNVKYAHAFYAVGFTMLYGLVFVLLNIFRVVMGPYPFLNVYDRSVPASIAWFVFILGLDYLIAMLLAAGNKKIFFRGVVHG